jgi:cellulose synthase/poly-beta-1,6-N-acetylglucosamine synthase-like glycosyltransferase
MPPALWLWSLAVATPVAWRGLAAARTVAGLAGLPRVAEAPEPAGEALVSVVVPARNEERTLGPCLASLAVQTHPALEVLVVDDGSEDGTPEVAARAARRDRRVRVLRVAGPPPGWTGKNHAVAVGAAAARGAWLCFTDADTVHAPDSLRRALGFAQARGLALLSMTSRQVTSSFWERVLQPVVFGLLDQWFPLARVNDPASPLAAANGIFVLVAREPYEAVGGHRAVAGEVLEDVALARRVKGSGRRVAFADGADLVAARMYEGFGAIRRGWTKNLYALRDRRPASAVSSAAGLLLTGPGPALACAGALLAGWPAGALAAGLAAAAGLGVEAWFRARRGWPAAGSLTHPLGAAVVAGFLLESAARAWLGLGVVWKDRRYT